MRFPISERFDDAVLDLLLNRAERLAVLGSFYPRLHASLLNVAVNRTRKSRCLCVGLDILEIDLEGCDIKQTIEDMAFLYDNFKSEANLTGPEGRNCAVAGLVAAALLQAVQLEAQQSAMRN